MPKISIISINSYISIGVMRKIKLDQFEGPLDLLLQLIEQQKMDITEVSLSQVTEQYIRCLHEAENKISLDELADFLVIAAKLLLIKSRVLLPYLQAEIDEGPSLGEQLKIYRQFHDASKVIQKIISRRHFSFSRPNLLIGKDIGFRPPKSLTAEKLAKAFAAILKELEPMTRLPKNIIKKSINISEKIKQLRELIFGQAAVNFKTVISQAKNKTEVVVSFLALLELVKQKVIVVRQERVFEEIEIRKVNSDK